MAVVFIPTRNRGELLRKVLTKWQLQRSVTEVIAVCEKWESGRTRAITNEFKRTSVLRLPKSNKGINYARNYIVSEADRIGLDRLIMADDDIYPNASSDVERLFEWEGLNCLGMGIMVPFYGLQFGNKTMQSENRPLMSKGALGKRLFSLNVLKVIEAGNFDPDFASGWGDDELVRDGMYKLQATWYVHAGVKGTSIAGRYTPGGLNDFHAESYESRLWGQFNSHQLIYEKWGEKYVNVPTHGGRLVFQWKKFMNDYVPDWQDRIDWEKE